MPDYPHPDTGLPEHLDFNLKERIFLLIQNKYPMQLSLIKSGVFEKRGFE
ncbi:hypothetical protein AHMF7616_03463 [Adhaeribacter pallidiroseus]|uniref:Uncharacterized protein n=1 Tax=Adhaeribacter pallidiroseus TaxID=2072847 RepID=A0A369QKC5_9BACT|nr:hypothetical protein AHMF7616_03463 [Adhaeribacter pallidiroseus]